MDINIDYKRDPKAEDEMSGAELTQNYFEYAVGATYKDGLDGQKRRIWGRIQRKLDNAIESKQYEIDFEAAEMDFIKAVFKDATFPPALSKYVVVLEDILDSIKTN